MDSNISSTRSPAELAFDSSPDAIFIESADGVILDVNPAACALHGLARQQLVGRHVLDLVPPERREEVARDFPKLTAGQWTADGTRVPVQIRSAPVEYDGRPALLLIVRDISEHRRIADELRRIDSHNRDLSDRQSMLLDELNHRVRNNLTGLMALVDLYQRSCATADEMAAAMRQKLLAMQSAHAMIARADWRGVDLRALLTQIVDQAAAENTRRVVALDGPDVRLGAQHASVVAMIAQELCANAVKHGALRRAAGRVDVRWRRLAAPVEGAHNGDGEPPPRLAVQWIESSSESISPPSRRGVGLRLIEGFATCDLAGRCEMTFDPVGFRCHLDWPLHPPQRDPAADDAERIARDESRIANEPAC